MALKSKASNKPQTVDEVTWYYEYDNYIEILHQYVGRLGETRTDVIKIPKRKLIKSLERMNTAAGVGEVKST